MVHSTQPSSKQFSPHHSPRSIHSTKELIAHLLSYADIHIDGERPWDIQVHDDRLYQRLLKKGSLGLGESYMEGWWDSPQVDEVIFRLIKAKLTEKVKTQPRLVMKLLLHKLINYQTKRKATQVVDKHYDLGNSLFQVMLDREMVYSCGYWKKAGGLNEAQFNKMELICQKLQLSRGMRLLDIGCGWGGLAKHAAQYYGAEVVGVTISNEQKKIAEEKCKDLPIEIRLQNYQDIQDKFDRIVSVGMFEHVGYKNYRSYMKLVHRSLSDEGLFLLHTIGTNQTQFIGDPWIDKYIFPNGMLPSIRQIGESIEGLFTMEDWHNFGADYDKTLMAWHHKFNQNWSQIQHLYDEQFFRMWNFYLLSCAGAFRARNLQLWQIVLSKHGIRDGYHFRF